MDEGAQEHYIAFTILQFVYKLTSICIKHPLKYVTPLCVCLLFLLFFFRNKMEIKTDIHSSH